MTANTNTNNNETSPAWFEVFEKKNPNQLVGEGSTPAKAWIDAFGIECGGECPEEVKDLYFLDSVTWADISQRYSLDTEYYNI